MGRHTRTAGALFTSLLLSTVRADITIGPISNAISYVNATGTSGTTLVPFSVSINSVPAADWDNVTYLNGLRSSNWNWGVNVSESSDAKQASDSGTTQSVISLSWPESDGPEANANAPWSYCALYIPEMGDSLLTHSEGNCANVAYGECEKAVVTYLDSQNILTDTHFTCSGKQTIPVPDECKTAFGSDAPSQLTMYASNSMTSGSPFISRIDDSQSLTVGVSRPYEAVLFELAQKGSERFPAAIFINCFTASTSIKAVLAPASSSSSSSSTNSTTSFSSSSPSSSSSSSSESAENYLTASSESASATQSSSSGSSSHSSSSGSSAAAATTTGKQPAAGGLGAASSISEGVATKMVVVAGAVLIAALL